MTTRVGSPVPVAHVEPFRVRFDECGAEGTLRTSAYLRYMQDAASVHSSNAGYTRAWYREHGIFWLVRFLDLRVLAPSEPGDVLAVSTEVTGFRRIWARRRSEFRVDGVVTAEADVDWVLTTAAGRPTRVPAEIVERFPASIADYAPGHLDLPEMPADALERSRRAEPQELDPMAHVNNAAYIDLFEAALQEVGRPDLPSALPRRYQIEYLAPAASGAILVWRVWPTSTGAAGGAAGRVRDDAGSEVARILAEAG
jgi:acyl-CoA thioester hydrolase